MEEYKRKKIRKSSKKKNNIIKEDTNIYYDEAENDKPKRPKKPKTKKPKKTQVEKVKKEREENFPLVEEDELSSAHRKNFKIIEKDKKGKLKKGFRSIVAICLVAIIIFSFSYFLPGGIIESVKGFFATMGRGEYPIEYNGSLILDSQTAGSCNYLLNDTTLSAYNNSGKELFKYQHGFINPVLCVSETRALLFNEGTDQALIFNKSGLLKSVNPGSKIINAAIGRNGTYAFSCVGGEYTSTVYVYSKKGKKIYTWNSAKDIVNSLCISPNGKKIAVSALNVSNAIASNKLYVLEYDSADPVFNKDFNEEIIVSMRSNFYGFATISENGYNYFSWHNYKNKEIEVKDKNLSILRTDGGDTLLIFNRSNDKTDNQIVYVSSFGNQKSSFNVNETITDIQFKNGKIFIVSDTGVFVYNKKGELLSNGKCDYGIKRFYIISGNRIAGIMDDKIERIII